MIVKRLEDVVGTKGEAHGDKWHSLRLLHEEDGMGVTLTDSILEAGFEMTLWQKNHLEACYCLEGRARSRNSSPAPSMRSRPVRSMP